MASISLDKQLVLQTCPHCQEIFSVCRGVVYDDGRPMALYLAALHKCFEGKNVHLTIGFPGGYLSITEPTSFAINVKSSDNNFEVRLVEPNDSPWKNENYLGRMINRDEARVSELKDTVFHIVDHIVLDIQEINGYLEK